MASIPRSDLPSHIAFRLGAGQSLMRDGGVSLRTAAQNAFLVGGARAGVFVNAFGESLKRDLINRGVMKRTHDELASKARRAAITAYQRRRPKREIEPYRKGSRVGYGLILAALSDPSHEGLSTAFRVVPFDYDTLDRMTRVGKSGALWRIINFGAKPRSGKGPKEYAVTMNNGGGFVLGFEDEAVPSGRMRRPIGIWLQGKRVVRPAFPADDEFRPIKKAATVPLKGIRATQFMDAVPRQLSKDFGPAYAAMFRGVVADQGQRERLARRGVPIKRPGRVAEPRFFNFRVTEG